MNTTILLGFGGWIGLMGSAMFLWRSQRPINQYHMAAAIAIPFILPSSILVVSCILQGILFVVQTILSAMLNDNLAMLYLSSVLVGASIGSGYVWAMHVMETFKASEAERLEKELEEEAEAAAEGEVEEEDADDEEEEEEEAKEEEEEEEEEEEDADDEEEAGHGSPPFGFSSSDEPMPITSRFEQPPVSWRLNTPTVELPYDEPVSRTDLLSGSWRLTTPIVPIDLTGPDSPN